MEVGALILDELDLTHMLPFTSCTILNGKVNLPLMFPVYAAEHFHSNNNRIK